MRAEEDSGARRADPDAAVERALARLNARIARHVEDHGTRHAFGTYVDPTRNRVVVETDAPDDLVDLLLGDDLSGPEVVVRRTRITDTTPGRS